LKCATSKTPRPFRTTAAVRRSAVEFEAVETTEVVREEGLKPYP
jgi:hypothetical protein